MLQPVLNAPDLAAIDCGCLALCVSNISHQGSIVWSRLRLRPAFSWIDLKQSRLTRTTQVYHALPLGQSEGLPSHPEILDHLPPTLISEQFSHLRDLHFCWQTPSPLSKHMYAQVNHKCHAAYAHADAYTCINTYVCTCLYKQHM